MRYNLREIANGPAKQPPSKPAPKQDDKQTRKRRLLASALRQQRLDEP